MKQVADGITMLKRYGKLKNAVWILQNGNEAAVVEMPPYDTNKEKPPYEKVRRFVTKNRLYLKYALTTHPHWDHCDTLPHFRVAFPETKFIAHQSFLDDPYFKFTSRNISLFNNNSILRDERQFFDYIFANELWQGDIGGEPLYIIHAPKHSYGDTLIIFKGAMITGDWYIGDLTDCNDLVPSDVKISSINRVMEIVSYLKYHIHMLFSGHGDSLFYDADFFSIMHQSKINHGGKHPNIAASWVPG